MKVKTPEPVNSWVMNLFNYYKGITLNTLVSYLQCRRRNKQNITLKTKYHIKNTSIANWEIHNDFENHFNIMFTVQEYWLTANMKSVTIKALIIYDPFNVILFICSEAFDHYSLFSIHSCIVQFWWQINWYKYSAINNITRHNYWGYIDFFISIR